MTPRIATTVTRFVITLGGAAITWQAAGLLLVHPLLARPAVNPPGMPQPTTTRNISANLDLSIQTLELTQAIQTENRGVELLGTRPTTLRVFVDLQNASGPVELDGFLEVYYDAQLFLLAYPDNGPVVLTEDSQREDESSTLNFTFVPPEVPEDITMTFVVSLDPHNEVQESNESNNSTVAIRYFSHTTAPSFVGMPIDYQAESAAAEERGTPEAELMAPGTGDAFLWGIYPFPELDTDFYSTYSVSSAPLTWTADVDDTSSELLDAIEARRLTMDPVPDFLYGWMRGNPYSGNGKARLPGHAAFGNTEEARFQRTYAHELGHNFGLRHIDKSIGEIGDTGWDTLDRIELGHLKPDYLYDVMVAGRLTDEAWISPDTYVLIHNDYYSRFVICSSDGSADCDHGDEPIHDNWNLVRAVKPRHPGDRWSLRPVFPIEALARAPKPSQDGRALIRLMDRHDNVLYQTAITPEALDEASSIPQITDLTVQTPYFSELHRLELYWDGQLQDVLERSPNPPVLHSPDLEPGTLVFHDTPLKWSASDEDRDRLSYLVQYSPDGGRTFVPLAVDVKVPEVLIQPDRLPFGEEALLKVTVSDGINASTLQYGPITVGANHPPVARILSPASAVSHRFGANIVISGSATDVDEQRFPPARLRWYSSLDGYLGAGYFLQSSQLSPGVHDLELRVFDQKGVEAIDHVQVTIR